MDSQFIRESEWNESTMKVGPMTLAFWSEPSKRHFGTPRTLVDVRECVEVVGTPNVPKKAPKFQETPLLRDFWPVLATWR